MTHDPLCGYAPDFGIFCSCPMIAKIRAEEKKKAVEAAAEAIADVIGLLLLTAKENANADG